MNRWLLLLSVEAPLISYPKDFLIYLKNNIWLFIICSIAIILHIHPISSPIYLVGDEALFLQGGLWIYDYFGSFWHKAIQYTFWVAAGLLLIVILKKKTDDNPNIILLRNNPEAIAIILLISAAIYFILLRDLPHDLSMVSYPPLYKFLYLVPYFTLGINYIGPRIVQLLFYILSAVYIYRTINMFSDKETALMGATIYLFSPIVFDYAHFAELHSGVIFFMILISYYFLRFIIYQDNRGLLLSSIFIGIGFLYKRDILLMFFICFAYLFLHRLKKRELDQRIHFKVLLLSLIPIVPWMIIGKLFYWRDSWVSLSRLVRPDTAITYLLVIPAHISWFIFFLFIISTVFVLVKKRSHLSLYYGFLFLAHYAFYTSQHLAVAVDRFAMAFYPTIGIFLSSFLRSISLKLRWEHSYKVIYLSLTIYIIGLCAVPAFRSNLITYHDLKAQYFPNEKAMMWVRDNVKNGEKILSLHFKPDMFYRDKYDIDPNKIIIYWTEIQEFFPTSEKLKAFCRGNKVSYIMFPDGPSFLTGAGDKVVFNYVKEDDDFMEITKFNLNENYIYIYGLKDNTPN